MNNSLTAYLAIGAIIFGMSHGWRSEKCGTFQTVDNLGDISVIIGWPAVFAMVFYDFETPEIPCKGESK